MDTRPVLSGHLGEKVQIQLVDLWTVLPHTAGGLREFPEHFYNRKKEICCWNSWPHDCHNDADISWVFRHTLDVLSDKTRTIISQMMVPNSDPFFSGHILFTDDVKSRLQTWNPSRTSTKFIHVFPQRKMKEITDIWYCTLARKPSLQPNLAKHGRIQDTEKIKKHFRRATVPQRATHPESSTRFAWKP